MASKKGKAERRSTSLESETVPVSATNFMEFFGLGGGALPTVNIETALKVPAVQAAVSFLSRTLATLPLHVYRTGERGPVRLGGKLAVVLEENPNDEMDTSKFRRFFWEQVFTGGRGLAWIERKGRASRRSGRLIRAAVRSAVAAGGCSTVSTAGNIQPPT